LAPSDGPAAWIRLAETPGVGLETARKLLTVFGLPENIFSASPAALRAALSDVVPERIIAALLAPTPADTQNLIARTLDWMAQPGNRVCTLADAEYPLLLLNIPDPPLMLYVKGRFELLAELSVAIVGSRNATAQGVKNAEQFALALSRAGLHTVSGLALGIDAAAHRGSLQGSAESVDNGSTVAIIGTGIDIVYPARNRELAHQIAAAGCIVSEYALGTPAIAANFPRRNRIISGLARGTLVVEAAAQSGSLITARMASEQGREVFAIPGSIHSPLSKGCHQLIRQGAKLVESAQDILEELTPYLGAPKAGRGSTAAAVPASDDGLLDALGHDPVDADTLAERSGLDAAALHGELLTLELEGSIEVLPGGLYRRLV
jgi:DNA processing protein